MTWFKLSLIPYVYRAVPLLVYIYQQSIYLLVCKSESSVNRLCVTVISVAHDEVEILGKDKCITIYFVCSDEKKRFMLS